MTRIRMHRYSTKPINKLLLKLISKNLTNLSSYTYDFSSMSCIFLELFKNFMYYNNLSNIIFMLFLNVVKILWQQNYHQRILIKYKSKKRPKTFHSILTSLCRNLHKGIVVPLQCLTSISIFNTTCMRICSQLW